MVVRNERNRKSAAAGRKRTRGSEEIVLTVSATGRSGAENLRSPPLTVLKLLLCV
jgi:hypothetical protein